MSAMVHLLVIFLLGAVPSATAQEPPAAQESPAAAVPAIPAPPAAPAALAQAPQAAPSITPVGNPPAPAPFQPSANVFPALPPARPCAAADIVGFWRMRQVHETPVGAYTADFAAYPHQYMLFSADNTYKAYKNAYAAQDGDREVLTQLQSQVPQNLQQYLVQDGGVAYFYRDGVAVDTQVCFIVANRRENFEEGDMLIMPPQGSSSARIVKVYAKTEVARRGRMTPEERQRRIEERQQQRKLQRQKEMEAKRQQRIQERQIRRQQEMEARRQQRMQEQLEKRQQQQQQEEQAQ